MYEQPNRRVVAEIALSLQRTGVLRNPVVVDLSRNLMIDGHHRTQALRGLGVSTIPCYTVDYLSTEVEARSWQWVTDATRATLADVFRFGQSGAGGTWEVLACDENDVVVASCSFPSAFAAATYLDQITIALPVAGAAVQRVHAVDAPATVEGTSPWRVRIFVAPVVDKGEVLRAVADKVRFPPQVNRHLIHGRPVGMRIALTALESDNAFARSLEPLWATARLVAGGHLDDARFYEESVIDLSVPR
jgi:hypothetical protein